MNVKTISTLILSGCVALSLAACAGTTSTSPDSTSSVNSSGSETQTNTSVNTAPESHFGKITSLVGNEVTLDFCETPDFMQVVEEGDLPDANQGGGVIESATLATPASRVEEGSGDVKVDVDKNEPIFEPVYTGENGEVVIPGSAAFVDLAGKGRTSLNDLKEGAIIGLDTVDGSVVTVYFMS